MACGGSITTSNVRAQLSEHRDHAQFLKSAFNTLKIAKDAGLELCSGGIFGMGENWDDRH